MNMPELAETMIGSNVGDLSWWQMSLRALLVFVAGIVIVRLGSARFLGQSTPFDFLVVVIIGSVLSRTINGRSPLLHTLIAAGTIVCVHWLFALLAFRFHGFGILIKGRERILIRDGVIDWDVMAQCSVSERDLCAAVRLRAGTDDVRAIRLAQLERTGEISVVKTTE